MEQERIRQRLVSCRRDIHRYPECNWLTFRTSILLAEQLERAGYMVYIGEEIVPAARVIDPPTTEEVKKAKERCRAELYSCEAEALWEKWESRMGCLGGVIAVYDSGRPGPVVACRFDTDALKLTESTDAARVPVQQGFLSCHEGSFHGCGHDGHTAVGLVSAERLMEESEALNGTLIFIFQPAEEGVRGARSYCENWQFGPVDVFLSGHIGFTGPDTFVAGAQQFLATTETDGEFIGVSAHAGAHPERGKNALLALAKAVVRMQDIPKPQEGTVRLNVGVMQAGEARNTIPAHAGFQMETRGSDDEKKDYMQSEAERILNECAKEYGVELRLKIKRGGECADSDESLSKRILSIVEECGLYEHCVLHQAFGASEDATSFMRMVQESGGQAAYMLFGCPESGQHHEDGFDFDETVLEKSCEIWIRVVRDVLK
ncbi:MAG: amidohydrolase [Lachnospiraceae bacterium]|nr:amidohydrolase [Lachnospiraceae bacterium]